MKIAEWVETKTKSAPNVAGRGRKDATHSQACNRKNSEFSFRRKGNQRPRSARNGLTACRKTARTSSLGAVNGKKATSGFSEAHSPDSKGLQADSLETYLEQLRDLCQDHNGCLGQDRPERIRAQTEQAIAPAAELGILTTRQKHLIGTSAVTDTPLQGTSPPAVPTRHDGIHLARILNSQLAH